MVETLERTNAASILKMSEAASMALHAMALLGANRGRPLTSREMAEELEVSETHLSKVMRRLVQAGFVASSTGPGGGFSLTREAQKIRLLEIYESIDGPLASGKCLLRAPVCSRKKCIMGGLLDKLNREVRGYLARTRVSDVIESMK